MTKPVPDQPETQAVVLLGRGGYSRAPQEQLERLVKAIQHNSCYATVLGAFIEKGQPPLPAALQQCAVAGSTRIVIVPLFLPADRHLQSWLTKVILRWRKGWSGQAITVIMAESLGDQSSLDAVVQAIAAEAALTGPDVGLHKPQNWQRDPADWSMIPHHRYHVLICQGPRCTAAGATEVLQHLNRRLIEASLVDKPHGTLLLSTGCQYPCNLGPMLIVYPDGVWYCGLTLEAIDQIVERHFVTGQVVETYARYPADHIQQRPT